MSALGLGCVKTRRQNEHSSKSRSGAQRFAGTFSIARLEKNHSRRLSVFFVFTQPRSRATDLRCSRDVRCSPISDRTAALHRVTLRANCRLIHRSKSVRRTTSSRCPFRPLWAQAVRQFFLVDAAIRLAWCRNLRSPLPSPSHGRRPSRAPSARSLGFPVWRHRP
jgi:hypothetical protein